MYIMILGKAHKFGDNIDTDAIIPAGHLLGRIASSEEL